jgi:hypothetical protein
MPSMFTHFLGADLRLAPLPRASLAFRCRIGGHVPSRVAGCGSPRNTANNFYDWGKKFCNSQHSDAISRLPSIATPMRDSISTG